MMKIACPLCRQTFLWTSEMPLKDRCPTPDCPWTYDVHAALRDNLKKRQPDAAPDGGCPRCGGPLAGRFTICPQCGVVIAGAGTFQKRHLLIGVILLLALLSLIVPLAWR